MNGFGKLDLFTTRDVCELVVVERFLGGKIREGLVF